MTDTARPTLADRFANHEVWLYVAADTVDEIHRRIANLLTGREFTVVRQYVGDKAHSFPEVAVNVRLDDRHYRGPSEVWHNATGCGTAFRYNPPTTGRFGVSGSYQTEAETAAAAHSKSHQGIGGNEVAHVYILGGNTPEEERKDAVIQIVRTNEHGVSTQIVIKPVIRWRSEAAEAEAAVLDRVAEHIDVTGQPLTGQGAHALAEYARYHWKTGLQVKPTPPPPPVLDGEERKVVDYLREHGASDGEDIEEATGCDWQVLHRLQQKHGAVSYDRGVGGWYLMDAEERRARGVQWQGDL